MRWILLPGFDGTGLLFDPLLAAIPSDVMPQVVTYPPQVPHSYSSLSSRVASVLPRDIPYVLIAESFSGPLAIRLAATVSPPPRAVILCASFAVFPAGRLAARLLALSQGFLFRFQPPRWAVKHFLLGWDAPDALIRHFYAAIASVSKEVLQNRLAEILTVDARSDLAALASLSIPMLYLRGSRDRLVGEQSIRVITQFQPKIQFETLNAPHLLLQHQPHEAVAAIERFIREHSR